MKAKKSKKMITGHNNDHLYKNTGNALLDFFAKAGSLYSGKGATSYYGGETSALKLFESAWKEDEVKSMKLLFWLRDRNLGAGNRSGFRDCIRWLAEKHQKWIGANLALIPHYGRWDDLKSLYGTQLQDEAVELWAKALSSPEDIGHIIACKWAKREDKLLQRALNMNEAALRKLLSVRAEHIVESKMCSDRWGEIDYSKIPSVAMSRYSKTFAKHDPDGFAKYKESLAKAENVSELIHAGVLFPYNCLVTARNGDKEIANAQFEALPNYMADSKYRIMPICDFSGSMADANITENVTRLDACRSLGLYCSDRLGKDNPFYRKVLEFSSSYEIIDWSKKTFADAVNCGHGNVASTNIQAALDGLLSTGKMFNVTNKQMPNVLLIISDMQFDEGAENADETVVESCMKNWAKEGYDIPKIIYWNLAGYNGSPSYMGRSDVVLVSGFSPALLTSVLGGEDFSPMAIMNKTIAKYDITVPKKSKGKKA